MLGGECPWEFDGEAYAKVPRYLVCKVPRYVPQASQGGRSLDHVGCATSSLRTSGVSAALINLVQHSSILSFQVQARFRIAYFKKARNQQVAVSELPKPTPQNKLAKSHAHTMASTSRKDYDQPSLEDDDMIDPDDGKLSLQPQAEIHPD